MAFPMEISCDGGSMAYDAIRADLGVAGMKAFLQAIAEAFPDGPDTVPDALLPHFAREPGRLSEAELEVEVFDIADLWLNFERIPGTPAKAWREVCEAAFPPDRGDGSLPAEGEALYRSGIADLERFDWAGLTVTGPVGTDGIASAEVTVTPGGKVFFTMEFDDGWVSNLRWLGLDGKDITEVAREDALAFPVGDPEKTQSVATELVKSAGPDGAMGAIIPIVAKALVEASGKASAA